MARVPAGSLLFLLIGLLTFLLLLLWLWLLRSLLLLRLLLVLWLLLLFLLLLMCGHCGYCYCSMAPVLQTGSQCHGYSDIRLDSHLAIIVNFMCHADHRGKAWFSISHEHQSSWFCSLVSIAIRIQAIQVFICFPLVLFPSSALFDSKLSCLLLTTW